MNGATQRNPADRFVVASQSVVGGRLVASHAFFGATDREARARFDAYEARKSPVRSTLGQPPAGPLVWSTLAPQGSDYAFDAGHRYAVLASVSLNYTLAEITDYLTSHGWAVTYGWEQGAPSRAIYPIDDWLQTLAPDTRANHRWVFVEANRTGESTTIGQNAPWPLTVYAIVDVFEAVPAPAQAAPSLPTAPAAPPAPGPAFGAVVLVALVGVALGVGGTFLWRNLGPVARGLGVLPR